MLELAELEAEAEAEAGASISRLWRVIDRIGALLGTVPVVTSRAQIRGQTELIGRRDGANRTTRDKMLRVRTSRGSRKCPNHHQLSWS